MSKTNCVFVWDTNQGLKGVLLKMVRVKGNFDVRSWQGIISVSRTAIFKVFTKDGCNYTFSQF